jgi:hypothetical protein
MAKKMIQDIYVVKKSIRMVKKSDVRDGFYVEMKKPIVEEKTPEIDNILVKKFSIETDENDDESGYIEEKKHVTKDSLFLLWIICIASIATLLFLLSSIFATATLSITPKNESVSLNDIYNISTDKTSSSLHYQIMTVQKDLSKNLETDGEQYVERKGTGKATLYNNFSTASQRIINNTRLQTKDGVIYRIRQSVEIPGIKTINGIKTPGSVEVDIIADLAGDKYNMKVSDSKGDFTIPGFQGSTKFTAFYGKLSADVVGGFIGNVKKVSDDKVLAGRTEIQNTLKDELIKDAYAKKTDQFILFKDNYYTACNDLPDDPSSGLYKITEECSIYAVLFDKDELSTFIAKNKIKDFDNSKVDVLWNDNDIVTLSGITDRPWTETSLKAKFSGVAKVVWSFDSNTILSAIVGQDKTVINSIIEANKNSLT